VSAPGRPAGPAIGDIVFAAVMIALAALVFVGTADLPPPRYEPIGSAAIPRGVAITMALLAVIVLVRALAGAGDDISGEAVGRRAVTRVLAIAGLLVAYVALMDARVVGFRIATVPFLALSCVILGGFGPRLLAVSAVFSVVLTLSVHAAFTRLFYIDLP